MNLKITADQNTIDIPEIDYLFLAKSQIDNSGTGLFSAINIYKDEIISIFKGEILSNREAKKRVKLGNDQYFINLLNGKILDCKNTTCFAKFANDGAGKYKLLFKNNSEITLDDNGNVCLVAIKNIKSLEEIFCDYGKSYWNKFSKLIP